jgi:predicted DNA-binding transcriptional regulator AlpA
MHLFSVAQSGQLDGENSKAEAIMASIEQTPRFGLMRLKQIIAPLGPISVSRSTWWAGVKDGRFPKPRKLGARITVWAAQDIYDLISGEPIPRNAHDRSHLSRE